MAAFFSIFLSLFGLGKIAFKGSCWSFSFSKLLPSPSGEQALNHHIFTWDGTRWVCQRDLSGRHHTTTTRGATAPLVLQSFLIPQKGNLFFWGGVPLPSLKLTYMGVSKNRGTPKSSILRGFSLINHPFWGTPILGNTHILYNPWKSTTAKGDSYWKPPFF